MAYCLWKYYPELPVGSSVLITDIESELSDATNANNHVKFKWKPLRKQVPFTVPRLHNIFNQEYFRLMPHAIHITTLKRMLQSPEPVDLKLWTHSGEIQCWHRCISLRYDFYKGTRRMKLLNSNEIRQLRDVCVFEINGMKVFM